MMSALLRRELHAPTVVASRTYPLCIGADTRLYIHVEHDAHESKLPTDNGTAAVEQGRIVHLIRIDASVDALSAPDAVMRVLSPCVPYTHPSQEPNDNSLVARAQRMAQASLNKDLTFVQVWTCLYAFFTLWPDQEWFVLTSDEQDPWRLPLLASGLAIPHPAHVNASHNVSSTPQAHAHAHGHAPLLVSRAAFWQGAGPFGPSIWVPTLEPGTTFPVVLGTHKLSAHGVTTTSLHPFRAPAKTMDTGVAATGLPIYRRFIPELGQTLIFRCASSASDMDVDLLHKWHATERVNTGWRQDMPREAHKKYLEEQEASSDSLALIGEWDGEPFGYMEVYYAKESALRTYFDAGDFDRGFHALVGEERFRGPHRVRSWMGSLIHMLFLLDPRTMRVVSEPRASNVKMVEYECLCGGHVEKVCGNDLNCLLFVTNTRAQLIDLPHKRAALVYIPRERFFQLCALGPLPGNSSHDASRSA